MEVSHAVVGAVIEVHRYLVAGLLESIYEAALHRELGLRGLGVLRVLDGAGTGSYSWPLHHANH